MNVIRTPQARSAATTYDAAADHFDAAPLGFWERHGRRTVEHLQLARGQAVLDAGCGTGASALPAATVVGPTGKVVGIDVAANMLECARTKALAQGLDNVVFEQRDMTAPGFEEASFDAALAVFSVFFVSDIEAQIGELWRMLRPGARLAVTVWCSGAFEPVASIFSEAVERVQPDLVITPRPWERLADVETFRRTLVAGGTSEPDVVLIEDRQPLHRAEDAWTVAMGSGFRREIEQLSSGQRNQVREQVINQLVRLDATAMEVNAMCALARKPFRGR